MRSLLIGLVSLALALFTVLGSAPALAQTPERGDWVGGAKGGGNINFLRGEGRDYTVNRGVAFGAWLDWALGGGLGVRPELLLTDKGGDYEEISGRDVEESLLYLELPILGRYELGINDWLSITGFAGPQVSMLLDAKSTDEDDARKFDVGAIIGAGANFYVSDDILSVDVRLDWGFVDALEGPALDARTTTIGVYFGVTM